MDEYAAIFKDGAIMGLVVGIALFLVFHGLTVGLRLLKHI